jgi:hypothetical protein
MATQEIDPQMQTAMQAQADMYGISLQDYKDLLAKYPPVYNANTQGGQYGMSAGGSYGQNPQLENALQTLQMIRKYGGTGAAQPAEAPVGSVSPSAPSYLDNTTAASPQAQTGPTPMAVGDQNAFGIKQVGTGAGYTTLQAANGQQINVDNAGNYFSIDANGNHVPVSDIDAQKLGFQSTNPETMALKQMGQIDPTSEALRTSLGQSYADTLAKAQKPQAADYQSYLDLFKQVDPEEYAQRAGLATSMDSYLKQVQDENALGSQLDPVTQMQVEQQARKAQADRGNLYGSGQAAVEAMTTGQAGQALKQQRLTNLQTALGGQQSYLGAGLGLGDTAMNLYQQGLGNKAAAQQGGLSYLTSGATPYQAGQTYLSNAEGAAANAAQGGPQYNPSALGAGNLGTSQQAPQYGLDVGSQAQNYFNLLNNSGAAGAPQKNRTAAAAGGAISGAVAGIPLAATTYGGSVVGGAIAGGLGGYYS